MRARSSVINVVAPDCDPGHRSSMRSGFGLVELLMVVMIAPFVLASISGLFQTFIRDVPQGIHLVQQNTTVLNMIDQVRRDVDGAVALPEQFGGRDANDATLLIEQPEAVVCYRFDDGRTVRTLLDGQGASSPGQERVWQARDARIEWRPWTRDGGVYAVELHSHLRQRAAGEIRRKLPGSYVFFIHDLSKGGETR